MAEEPQIATVDVGDIRRWIDDPEAPLGELIALLPFLGSEAGARRYLDGVREGLEAARAGRVVSHEQVLRDAAERRLRYRPSAAE